VTPQDVTIQLEQRHALQALWRDLLPDRAVDPHQFNIWLRLHPFSRVVIAIEQTGKKSVKLAGQMDVTYAVKFASSVANNLKSQEQAA
jgi:hypothetical protein